MDQLQGYQLISNSNQSAKSPSVKIILITPDKEIESYKVNTLGVWT